MSPFLIRMGQKFESTLIRSSASRTERRLFQSPNPLSAVRRMGAPRRIVFEGSPIIFSLFAIGNFVDFIAQIGPGPVRKILNEKRDRQVHFVANRAQTGIFIIGRFAAQFAGVRIHDSHPFIFMPHLYCETRQPISPNLMHHITTPPFDQAFWNSFTPTGRWFARQSPSSESPRTPTIDLHNVKA